MSDIIDLTQAKRLIAQYRGELAKLRAELDKERQRRFDGNQIASEEARAESREQQNEIERLRAELAELPGGMTVLDLADDDALRFVQRVLESQAPEQDKQRARDMIVAIRTRLRMPVAGIDGREPEGD